MKRAIASAVISKASALITKETSNPATTINAEN